MNTTASQPVSGTPWSPEYERLTIHCSSCPTCTAVDKEGANLARPCAEGRRVSAEYRQSRRGG
ncbi:hypothetical protein [Streptomyces sp. NRRL S-146]|uniref:hypothetical protein n=1 Tax=Streptomyces sp. NRRL S-146 TaxID=1463884 RepID=UPI0004C5E449|nr:hypothetical protein [Streptomyces sp. NRRL S-146]